MTTLVVVPMAVMRPPERMARLTASRYQEGRRPVRLAQEAVAGALTAASGVL